MKANKKRNSWRTQNDPFSELRLTMRRAHKQIRRGFRRFSISADQAGIALRRLAAAAKKADDQLRAEGLIK